MKNLLIIFLGIVAIAWLFFTIIATNEIIQEILLKWR
jgi:hypothetical protein